MSLFGNLCRAIGLPEPVEEYRFAPPRRWRFDYAFVSLRLAVEVEGGIYGRGQRCPMCGRRAVGAHTSISRLVTDIEKYNTAAVLGWRLLRVTPEMLDDGRALAWLERFVKETSNG